MKRQSGFTLVEMAVVALLIGIFAAIGITALKAQLAGAASSATKKKQEVIKDALIAYLAKNRRLPCPAVDTSGGLDATVRDSTKPPENCITYFGIVPYAELGLPKSAAMDGWENFFTYTVSQQWTATLSATCPNGAPQSCTPDKAFNVGNSGTIKISDRSPASAAPSEITVSNKAVVVLISYGVSGEGAYTTKGTQNAPPSGADEIKNAIPPNALPLSAVSLPTPDGFFQREFIDKDAGYGAFDDIVSWYSASDLLNPLIKDGAMKSAYGQYADQVANIKEWVVGYILSNSCKIPSTTDFPTNLKNDPWGKAVSGSTGADFEYQKLTNSSIATLPSASAVNATYTLKNISANQIIDGPTIAWLRGTYKQCPTP